MKNRFADNQNTGLRGRGIRLPLSSFANPWLALLLIFGVSIFPKVVPAEQASLVPLPVWLSKVPALPDWWQSVNAEFIETTPKTNCWAHIEECEHRIDGLIKGGIPPTRERRELIKYISLFEASQPPSTNERTTLRLKTASLYSRLGDHRSSAKEFADVANARPGDWVPLQLLAKECERVGDNESALGIYMFTEKELKSQPGYELLGPSFIRYDIIRLEGVRHDCELTKPTWWAQFIDPPSWLTNASSGLPSFTCYLDCFKFISTLEAGHDRQKLVRAAKALSEYTPVTAEEKEEGLKLLALSYSSAEDHHRAIEVAWRIPEQFSFDVEECPRILEFIAKQFERLGEPVNAKAIRAQIPCFSATQQKH